MAYVLYYRGYHYSCKRAILYFYQCCFGLEIPDFLVLVVHTKKISLWGCAPLDGSQKGDHHLMGQLIVAATRIRSAKLNSISRVLQILDRTTN